MNSLFIKNIIKSESHVYYGKKSIQEYTYDFLEKDNILDYIIEKKSDELIHVFQKVIHKGYFYNSVSINLLYTIQTINIVIDEKSQQKKVVVSQIDDAFIQGLKETLSKRLKNKLE
jgi:hypothetical protein